MWCSAVGCIVTLTLSLLVAPLAAEAQPPIKVARVGWLSDGIRAGATSHLHEAFLHGLRDLGYVEGQNLVMERRDAEGQLDRLPALAAQLVAPGGGHCDVGRARDPRGPAGDQHHPHCYGGSG